MNPEEVVVVELGRLGPPPPGCDCDPRAVLRLGVAPHVHVLHRSSCPFLRATWAHTN